MKKIAPLSQTQLGIYSDCLSMQEAGAYNTHVLFVPDDSIDLTDLPPPLKRQSPLTRQCSFGLLNVMANLIKNSARKIIISPLSI